jgi:alanyl-tRNA synthetase
MTERLYYADSTLLEFDARVTAVRERDGHAAVALDRSAFYPASGGQLYDTGLLRSGGHAVRVLEVAEDEGGEVLHLVQSPLAVGDTVRGEVDGARRRDHMQQHTGQHLLSAAFLELFRAPTVSFHMGDESCSIDLDTKALTDQQVREAERRVNQIVTEDRPVTIRSASAEEARDLGVRKIPPGIERLRLIDISGYDLNACGGTHVARTGEIGAILLRKTEKVKQGARVEFVCGGRAVATARRDFDALTEAASLFSAHIYDLSAQIRKVQDEAKSAGKRQLKVLEEVAELMAERILARTPAEKGIRRVVLRLDARDLAFVKLLAQKLVAGQPGPPGAAVVALLATAQPQPTLVFAQSSGGPYDMGALMRQAMTAAGGRGGGTRDMAQGGVPAGADLDAALRQAEANLVP